MGNRANPHGPRASRSPLRLIRAGAAGLLVLGVLATVPPARAAVPGAREAAACTPVSTAQQFQAIGQSAATLAGSYCLQNDLDLATLAAPFAPVGQSTALPFIGTFDGQGHTIAHLTIAQSGTNPIGLFGAIGTGATVENVHLTGVSVTGGANMKVGGLAGTSRGSVTAVDVAGSVSGSTGSCVGGVIGLNDQGGTIAGSHNAAAVTGTGTDSYVGGLAGQSAGGAVSQSSNSGPVTGSGWVGGLLGYLESGSLDQDYNTGQVVASWLVGGLLGVADPGTTVSRSYNTGAVTGQGNSGGAGGLIGMSNASISQSYDTGTVSDTADSADVGGLVAASLAPITRSYHVGTVTGGTHGAIGGLVGGENEAGTINETYSAGAVTGADATDQVGGLIGGKANAAADGPVTSFFDFSLCGCAYGSIGIGDHTSDMVARSTYVAAGWDLTATWNINDGQSYPYFKWVLTPPVPLVPTATVTATGTATATATSSATPTPSATPTATVVPTWTAVPLVQQVIQLPFIAPHRYGDPPFTLIAAGGGSGNPVTFQTSGTCTATGIYGSTISLTGAGTCTVRAYQEGNASYAAALPVSETFTIERGVPAVSWAKPANIRYGTRLGTAQLDARSPVAGVFRYAPAAGSLLQAGANQSLRAIFIPANGADWVQVAASTTITVLQAIPRVVLTHLPKRTYGDASFKLGVSGNEARTTTRYAARGTCRVGGSGGAVLSLTGAGTCTVSATQPGTRNYAAVAVPPVTFAIAKAKPTIRWAKQFVITAGTPLGSGQLNARASFKGSALAGTYRYSPPLGTKLAAGTHTLHLTFTPNDRRNFVAVSASATVVVRKR